MNESEARPDDHVVVCAQPFLADELPGFEKTTLTLPAEDDGPLAATLVRTLGPPEDPRPAVLYVHGFVDYFFQEHMARAFEDAGYRFYAIDLRRHGRSLREGNRPCLSKDIGDFFAELDWAVDTIKNEHQGIEAVIGHSTGGLVAALYFAARKGTKVANKLVLTSPFLRFNLGPGNRALSWLLARVARLAPNILLPQRLSPVYGMTIHQSEQGEWAYDLKKKPLTGFPLYAGWFRLIRAAHRQVEDGLELDLPILSLHAERSRLPRNTPVPADFEADLILNVNHIKELSPRLGNQVRLVSVPHGIHDLTLSKKPARDLAIATMVSFVQGKE